MYFALSETFYIHTIVHSLFQVKSSFISFNISLNIIFWLFEWTKEDSNKIFMAEEILLFSHYHIPKVGLFNLPEHSSIYQSIHVQEVLKKSIGVLVAEYCWSIKSWGSADVEHIKLQLFRVCIVIVDNMFCSTRSAALNQHFQFCIQIFMGKGVGNLWRVYYRRWIRKVENRRIRLEH